MFRVADPGFGIFLTPESRIRILDSRWKQIRIRESVSEMNIEEHFFRELKNSFLALKYLNSLIRMRMRMRYPDLFDPGSGTKKFGSGIRYKHPGSATLFSI